MALVRNGFNAALNKNITEILYESEEFEIPKFVVASVRLTFEEFEKVSDIVNAMVVEIEKVKKARVHSASGTRIRKGPKELQKKKQNINEMFSLTLSDDLIDKKKNENGEKYIMASVRIDLEDFKFVMDLMNIVNIEIDGLVDEVKLKPDKVKT